MPGPWEHLMKRVEVILIVGVLVVVLVAYVASRVLGW
jgi:hypothetical protein